MGQDIFDVIIVLVLTAFAARGFWTGFVGEVAGLISIVGGFWVSHHFHTVLAPHLTFITEPAWRNIASYVLLFLGVLIAVGLLARLLQKLLAFSFVGWIDKLTGGLLGLAGRACCSAPWSCCCCKTLRRCRIPAPFARPALLQFPDKPGARLAAA